MPSSGNDQLVVEVVSSAADQVTGGDARLHIAVPGNIPLTGVQVLVNGEDQSDHFSRIDDRRMLTGVVDSLELR